MSQYSFCSPAKGVSYDMSCPMPLDPLAHSPLLDSASSQKETLGLLALSQQFPELPLFISHEHFGSFFHLWIIFQKQIDLAHLMHQQWIVQMWLGVSLKELDQFVHIVCGEQDFRLDSRALLAALRQLRGLMETMYHMLRLGHWNCLPSCTEPVAKPEHEEDYSVLSPMPVLDWTQPWSSVPPLMEPLGLPLVSLPATPTWTEDSSLSIEETDSGNETSQKKPVLFGAAEDEDYIASLSSDDEELEKPRKRQGKVAEARRTATSYDAHTTRYLKAVFFDIYSVSDKLTKEQRRKVQQDTGLKPRNITYWFSNHKRRFQNSLAVFRKTVNESHGQIKTYHEFLKWRKDNGLSEDILENE